MRDPFPGPALIPPDDYSSAAIEAIQTAILADPQDALIATGLEQWDSFLDRMAREKHPLFMELVHKFLDSPEFTPLTEGL